MEHSEEDTRDAKETSNGEENHSDSSAHTPVSNRSTVNARMWIVIKMVRMKTNPPTSKMKYLTCLISAAIAAPSRMKTKRRLQAQLLNSAATPLLMQHLPIYRRRLAEKVVSPPVGSLLMLMRTRVHTVYDTLLV